jgi:hypothetical protein
MGHEIAAGVGHMVAMCWPKDSKINDPRKPTIKSLILLDKLALPTGVEPVFSE